MNYKHVSNVSNSDSRKISFATMKIIVFLGVTYRFSIDLVIKMKFIPFTHNLICLYINDSKMVN